MQTHFTGNKIMDSLLRWKINGSGRAFNCLKISAGAMTNEKINKCIIFIACFLQFRYLCIQIYEITMNIIHTFK